MADFVIRIPRLSVAVAEATLVDTLVAEGQRVEEGSALYVVETEKVETEVVAGASGTVHWTSEVGIVYGIGEEIGLISTDG
jgi:pyruvate/2-oxoglutarate dehydrogenase complex dihydrolipoamide acyltransferase (E2) component